VGKGCLARDGGKKAHEGSSDIPQRGKGRRGKRSARWKKCGGQGICLRDEAGGAEVPKGGEQKKVKKETSTRGKKKCKRLVPSRGEKAEFAGRGVRRRGSAGDPKQETREIRFGSGGVESFGG